MTKFWKLLASLKLAVILLVLLLVGLAAGTIIESKVSADVAGRVVYYAPWFLGLQGLFAVNLAAAIVDLFPWGRPRVGFLITHASMLVIVAGAGMTYFFKTEGMLGLWEGQSGHVIESRDRAGTSAHELPFDVTLDDFQIDHYPGTMRPAMFRSQVRITDRDTGKTFPAAVWMNHELEHRGYRLFQSSYQQQDGREASIFSVAKDPGQWIVFAGYALLVLGMCVVLGTRIQARRRMRPAEEQAVGVAKKTAVMLAMLGALGAGTARADADLEAIRRLPVQHDGRAMAFDTLARESVRKVTGQRSWQGEEPSATVVGWLQAPQAAANAPVVKVDGDLAKAAGVEEHSSFLVLVSNGRVLALMDEARTMAGREEQRRGAHADAEALEERLLWMQDLLRGEKVRPIPGESPQARWASPRTFARKELVALSNGPRLQGWPSAAAMDREITYNDLRPARIAWIVLAVALVASLLGWSGRRKALDLVSLAGLAIGFGVMTWGIATRWAIGDRIPAANMYESLLFLAWGVGLFAVIAFAFMRNRLVVMNANAMAALTMALVDLLPMDGFIHPVPPVLSGTPWLAIHVPIIMVSYSVYALGVVVAHMQIGFGIFAPKKVEAQEKCQDLLYWYMHVGSILLIAGILTGSVWAASSWGRYWGWDPKEVWSLVAFLGYMAILHAKVDKLIGPFGVAAISIVAFQTILMTYLGVNYVLASGLHSYGFGDSPVVFWMIVVALIEAAFVGVGWWFAARRRADLPPSPAVA